MRHAERKVLVWTVVYRRGEEIENPARVTRFLPNATDLNYAPRLSSDFRRYLSHR
jgi:hypothetical protein